MKNRHEDRTIGKWEKGIAIVTVMAMVTVCTILVTVVLYFVFKGTQTSALQKRYQTAREASFGGIEVLTKEIIPAAIGGTTLSTVIGGFSSITTAQVAASASNTCFADKLTKPTANWAEGCSNSFDAKTSPDITFTLTGAAPATPYRVYAKIVESEPGNSNRSGIILEGMGTADSASGLITVQQFPYIYRIESQGEKQTNPDERAVFTVLYAY